MYPQNFSPVRQVDFALFLIFAFSALVLCLLTAVTLWFIWRYNHTRNPRPEDIRGNLTAELLWTVIPSLMVLGLFYFGWTGFKALRTVPENAMEVAVEARMFSWNFTYPGGKTSPVLVVPVDTPVKLNIRSRDVIHSFFAPAFRIKMDAVPGMDTYAWFSAARQGEYEIFCAEYCGMGHADMHTSIRAVPADEFQTWLQAAPEAAPGPDAGKTLLEAQGCFGCHSVDGAAGTGPALNDLYGATVIVLRNGQETQQVVDDAYLEESIRQPGAALASGYADIMPPYEGFSAQDMQNAISYLRSISSHAPAAPQEQAPPASEHGAPHPPVDRTPASAPAVMPSDAGSSPDAAQPAGDAGNVRPVPTPAPQPATPQSAPEPSNDQPAPQQAPPVPHAPDAGQAPASSGHASPTEPAGNAQPPAQEQTTSGSNGQWPGTGDRGVLPAGGAPVTGGASSNKVPAPRSAVFTPDAGNGAASPAPKAAARDACPSGHAGRSPNVAPDAAVAAAQTPSPSPVPRSPAEARDRDWSEEKPQYGQSNRRVLPSSPQAPLREVPPPVPDDDEPQPSTPSSPGDRP